MAGPPILLRSFPLRCNLAMPLFFAGTLCMGPPNRSDRPRRAIALHFAIDSLAYQPHGKFKHLNERLVTQTEGKPDFTDATVCPLLWKKEESLA